MQNNNDNDVEGGSRTDKSSRTSETGDEIRLQTKKVGQRSVVTSAKSPFGDSTETVAKGIKVHKTVVVSRVVDSDEDSESGTSPWQTRS